MLDSISSWEAISAIILVLLFLLLSLFALLEYLRLRYTLSRAEKAEWEAYATSQTLRHWEDERRKARGDLAARDNADETERELIRARERDLDRAREEADFQQKNAARLATGMRAFWTLAILVFIPVLLVLIILRPAPPLNASTSVTVPGLEKLAQKGVSDLEALVEVLKARAIPGTFGPDIPVVGATIGLTLLGRIFAVVMYIALAGMAVGAALMLFTEWKDSKKLTSASALVATIGSLFFFGISFFKEGSLFGALVKFEGGHVNIFKGDPPDSRQPLESTIVVNVFPWMEETIQVVSATNVEFYCDSKERPLHLETFVSGTHNELIAVPPADAKKTIDDAVNDLRGKIATLYKDKTLVGLLLIGYADKTPLGKAAQAIYNTNLSLAQQRAQWVRDELKASSVENGDAQLANLSTVVILGAAPYHTKKDVKSPEMEKDRTVSACVAVRSKPQK